ncbi:putative polysaccharide biosynthesis protein [Carnobacterium funditum]|uniref:putative polysaccharide biosynthesis protein n=1 Tax=Carnobacterium funditum TaxID=2752 RepID=UPI00054DD628|nr:oligosaccharide flippase family protein [Carnobacterium funditum]
MDNQQMRKTMNGAVLLSLAALIAKILSAVYRVPFQNIVGNTGFYVYQQVYPIYGIGMTIALSGLPVFLSKLIAEQKNEKRQTNLIKKVFMLLAVFSIFLFSLVFFGSDWIAQGMGDRQLSPIIQSVSWLFLLVPVLTTTRGYFQGTFHMMPTAVSQVVEQVIRVTVILLAAFLYKSLNWDVYQMGTAAMSSSWIAGLAASLVLGIALLRNRETVEDSFFYLEDESSETIRYSLLTRRFMTEGLAICLLSALLILLQLIDSFTLYKGLTQSGISSELAKNAKGIYDRGQPLIQLGMIVATAFSTTLIPILSRAVTEKKETKFLRSASSMVRMTLTFSIAATTGLIVLMPYINQFLFGDRSGVRILSIYMLAILFASLIGTYNAILQSRNQYYLTMVALMIGLLVKWLANTWLIIKIGTIGASIATVLSLVVILFVVRLGLPVVLRKEFKKNGIVFKLAWLSLAMATIVWLGTQFIEKWIFNGGHRIDAFALTILGVIIGVRVFLYGLSYLNVLTIREWLSLPFGKKMLRK